MRVFKPLVSSLFAFPSLSHTLHSRFFSASFRLQSSSMATKTLTRASLSFRSRLPQLNRRLVSHSIYGRNNLSFSLQPCSIRLRVSCTAKPETVEKVCKIVKKQLALPDDSDVTGESKFAALGADSLDTVEIVMGLEEEFGISVEEDSAQSITTVQEAADLIEEIIKKQSP